MRTFDQFLTETYVNAFDAQLKRKYADQVWEMIQKAYAQIGGIKGSGFESKEAMVAKIPFWKLVVRAGAVVALTLYKDKGGRKSVASATNGTPEGKAELKKIILQDFTRSYREVSDSMELFIKKNYPELFDQFKIPAKDVPELLGEPVQPSVDGYHYTRDIGGERHEKIMLGTPGKRIVR